MTNPGSDDVPGDRRTPRRLIARGVDDWDYVRTNAGVVVLAEFGGEHGLDPALCLADSGLNPNILNDPNGLVQAHQEMAVARNLLRHLGDRPGLGLEVGSRFHLTTFGAWGYTLVSSPTLRDAVETGMEFAALTFAFSTISSEIDGDSYIVRLSGNTLPVDVRRFLVERDCAAIITLRRDLFGDPAAAPLRRVAFGFPAADSADVYRKFFGAPVAFEAGSTELICDAPLLDQRLPQANNHTTLKSAEICRQLIDDRGKRGGAAQAVHSRLVARDGVDRGIDFAAQELSTTSRTLRRRLSAEGTSYRALVDEVRFTLAHDALHSGDVSTEELARRFGYAEPASFIRAFRRWTGTTPQQWAEHYGQSSAVFGSR